MAAFKSANPTTTVQSTVATQAAGTGTPRNDRLKDLINTNSVKDMFKNAMAEHADSFLASVVDLYNNDKSLQACAPNEVLMEAFKAATLKLPINKQLGFAYIVPYKDYKTSKSVPTFQIGYKGLIQLAMRTAAYKHINAGPVFEGELRNQNKLTGEIDLSGEKKSDKVLGYFAYIETINGFSKTLYWDINKVTSHSKKYSKSINKESSPWNTDFDAMASKTLLRALIGHYGLMSVEMQTALMADTVKEADLLLSDGNSKDITPDDQQPDIRPASETPSEDGMSNMTMDDLPEALQ